jgi:hypothetical protein
MQDKSSASFQLVLGTGAFALCFAVFGSMSAMMPIILFCCAVLPYAVWQCCFAVLLYGNRNWQPQIES